MLVQYIPDYSCTNYIAVVIIIVNSEVSDMLYTLSIIVDTTIEISCIIILTILIIILISCCDMEGISY